MVVDVVIGKFTSGHGCLVGSYEYQLVLADKNELGYAAGALSISFAIHFEHTVAMALISRQNVLQKLQNQTLHIKGLHSSFNDWPFQVNSYVDRVRYDVNYMVTRYGTLEFVFAKRLRNLQANSQKQSFPPPS